jgi:glycosyltransferase involved in cell wall biosynthesis
VITRRRCAIFSPVPPVKSGISDYTVHLVSSLVCDYDIDLFLDGYTCESDIINRLARTYPRREFEWRNRLTPYDSIIYHIGNNQYHQYMYPVLFRYPGIVFLHDANLHRARAYEHLSQNRLGDYIEELQYCYGGKGEETGWIIAKGFSGELLYDRFPMLNLACEAASGLIVHNAYSEQMILNTEIETPTEVVPFPYHPEILPDRDKARADLSLMESETNISSFGFIGPGKGLESLVSAFCDVLIDHPDCRLFLVGKSIDESYLCVLLGSLRESARSRIVCTGYVPEETYRRHLSAADICVNLRYPSQGESSSALLRIFGAAKPALISWYRQYREIPRDICVHIDPYPRETDSLSMALRYLISHPAEAEQIGQRARNYVLEHHRPDVWIGRIKTFLQRMMDTKSAIKPLSRRCELNQVRSIPIDEHMAVVLSGWGTFTGDDMIVNELMRVAGELGIDER